MNLFPVVGNPTEPTNAYQNINHYTHNNYLSIYINNNIYNLIYIYIYIIMYICIRTKAITNIIHAISLPIYAIYVYV